MMLRATVVRQARSLGVRSSVGNQHMGILFRRAFATNPQSSQPKTEETLSNSDSPSTTSTVTSDNDAPLAGGPKISHPEKDPVPPRDEPRSGGMFKWGVLFAAVLGSTGYLYMTEDGAQLRKTIEPYIPWDTLSSGAKTIEKSAAALAKQTAKTLEESATTLAKQTKDKVMEAVHESTAAKKSSPTSPPASSAIAPTKPDEKPVESAPASNKPKASKEKEPQISADVPAKSESSTSSNPVEQSKPIPRAKAIDSLHASLARLDAIFSAISQTSPEVRPALAKVKSVLQSAEHDLQTISGQLELLTDDQNELVTIALAQQAEEFKSLLNKHEQALSAKHKEQLESTIAEARAELDKAQQGYEKDLQKRQSAWTTETEQKLASQAKELETAWNRQLQERLDHERNGRLARLDHLTLKLKYLESVAMVTAEKLHRSYYVHSLFAALKALNTTLFDDCTLAAGSKRTPFTSEWALLHKLALGDELISAVLEGVPDETQLSGIATLPELHYRFSQSVVPEVRRAALLLKIEAAKDTFAHHLAEWLPKDTADNLASIFVPSASQASAVPHIGVVSYTLSRIISTFLPAKNPDLYTDLKDVESVLARAEYHLQREDLDGAARTVNQLQGWPKLLACAWLDEARRLLEVKMAMEAMEAQVQLMALGAV